MSRVKRLENTSGETLVVKHGDGVMTSVPPGGVLQNARIANLEEVNGQASVTMDLGEIEERGHGSGRIQLRD